MGKRLSQWYNLGGNFWRTYMQSSDFHRIKQLLTTILIAAALLLAVVGCNAAQSTATPTDTPPTSTPKPVSTAADFIASNPNPTGITITLWTVEQFSPQINLVNQTLTTFEANSPPDHVSVFVKKVSGQASAVNYLLSAKTVAPDILPDVLILRDDQLPQAWRTGLLQPLSGKIDRTIVQDLLPAARALGTIDGSLAAIPLQMNVEHLVANTTLITPTPLSWQDVLSANVSYRFAGVGQNGNLADATLLQYRAAGGTLTNADGTPALSPDALRAVLEYYRDLRAQGDITPAMFAESDPTEFWTDYKNGNIALTHIDTRTYLSDRHQLRTSVPAPIPTQTGKPAAIVHGWVIALITPDPFRQDAAINLIETFLSTEATTAWASYAQAIPPTQNAFTLVAGDDPYWQFLGEYLVAADTPPTFSGYTQMSRTIQQAVESVVNDTATVDDALQVVKDELGQ